MKPTNITTLITFRAGRIGPKAAVIILLALLVGAIGILPAQAATDPSDGIFSYGSGPVILYIFTDYFCPPCQSVEPFMEATLPQLSVQGVKIVFVDRPVHKKTPLYAKYFLFAAQTAGNLEGLLKARHALFDIAKTEDLDTEPAMVQALKKREISLRLIDPLPLFNKWVVLINRFKVTRTPTCVVTRPGQDDQILQGPEEIRTGLKALLQSIGGAESPADSGETG